MNDLSEQNQALTNSDPEIQALVQTGSELSESLALLQNDLQSADAKLLTRRQQLAENKLAVTKAESELAEIMKLRESAPRVLHEKENFLKDAELQLNLKQKEYSDFKHRVDQQKAKTDKLLQKYLQALPQ